MPAMIASTCEIFTTFITLFNRQPGLQSEFQDSQGSTEKPCLKKKRKERKNVMNVSHVITITGILKDAKQPIMREKTMTL